MWRYFRLLSVGIFQAMLAFGLSQHTQAMGVDVCFNDPASGEAPIRNCIGVGQACREQPLDTPFKAFRCRIRATADSLGGLTGTNAIIGGRSLLHSDSAYAIAQLLGYSPWQAYQILIYAEATDQSSYEPFDQNGALMMSTSEMDLCYDQAMRASYSCLGITPKVLGLYKFNDTNGGQLLHEHPRYGESPDIPDTVFPTDYTSMENQYHEVLINNLRAWAFDQRDDLCIAGITEDITDPLSPCLDGYHLDFPMYFFGFAYGQQVQFRAELGTLMLNDDPTLLIATTSEAMAAYLPHDPDMARMGIYLHSLADRISHHMCTDRSTMYRETDGNFNTEFSSYGCGQGSHFLWHVWEQGTDQNAIADQDYRTLEVALDVIWDELVARGRELGIEGVDSPVLDKATAIQGLLDVLGIYESAERLNAMVEFLVSNGLEPLPGHGAYAGASIDTWLETVGAADIRSSQ